MTNNILLPENWIKNTYGITRLEYLQEGGVSLEQVTTLMQEYADYVVKTNKKPVEKIDFLGLLNFFNEKTGRKTRFVNEDCKRKLNARLREGYTKDDIKKTIIEAVKDEFHIESNMRYVTLEYISRSRIIDKYSSIAEQKPEKVRLNMNT